MRTALKPTLGTPFVLDSRTPAGKRSGHFSRSGVKLFIVYRVYYDTLAIYSKYLQADVLSMSS